MKETVIDSFTRTLLLIMTLIFAHSQVFIISTILPTVSALYSNNLGFNPYIVQYDKLNYIRSSVRQRRSVSQNSDEHEQITFESHGRRFDLRLKRASSSREHHFASANIEIDDTRSLDSLVTFYTGYLADQPHESFASGAIIDGAFYGTIRTRDNHKYFVEAARKFNRTIEAHSIVYREQDLRLNHTQLKQYKRDLDEMRKRQLRSNSHSHEDHNIYADLDPNVGCASDNSKVKEWMRKEQEALYNERIQTLGYDQYSYLEEPYYKYSKEANEPYSIKDEKSRFKRDSQTKKEPERIKFPGERTICNLYLRVDPYLHTEIYNNEGNKDLDKTTAFILFYLNKHVEALNSIYNSLPFYDASKDKYLVGVQFMIYRTKIITEEQCRNKTVLTAEELKLCEPYLDVSTFLNYVSLDNFTDYCLAYTFTARDFTDGTLGLAWVAKLSGSVGGVCEKRQTLQGVAKSLNSGIVTVVNYQARVPEAVSQITFAHEVGHNFGSEHDPDDTLCSPGAQKGGNFIMYRRATTGTDRNNRNFSDCSRDQMGPILHALALGSKFCFKQYNGSLCGNGIVEEGEECDCGYGTDCKESCCIDASQDINKCKLKQGKQCSPSQGPCCDSQCNFASAQTVCMHSTECLENVMCSGRNATCPHNDPSYFKPDKTECNSGTQVCKSGICSGSICEKYEMQQCFLEGNLKDKKQDKAVLCHLACIGEKTNNMCMDSFEISEMTQPNATKGLILKPGSPCVGTLGYCDIFSKCRAVDAEGPLARLKNILLNPETLLTIRDWITTYWWAALLIGIGFIIFMAIFLKVCSVHTPSSNPRKPPALKITETLRRPIKKYQDFQLAHHLNSPMSPLHRHQRNHSSKSNKSKPSQLPHIPHPHFRHHQSHNGDRVGGSVITATHNESRLNKVKQERSQSNGNKMSQHQQAQKVRRTSTDKNESRSKSKNERKNSSEIIELNKSRHQNKIKETSTAHKSTSPEEERIARGTKRHLFNKRRHQYIDSNHHERHSTHNSSNYHQSSAHHSHLNHHNYHHSRLSEQKRTRYSKSADAAKLSHATESSSRALKSTTKSKSPANHRSHHQQQHRLKTSDFVCNPIVMSSSSNHQSQHLNKVAKARKRSSTESSSIDT